MIQTLDLKNVQLLEPLHDSKASSFEFNDDKIIFYFTKDDLNATDPNGEKLYPNCNLKLSYVLSNYEENIDLIKYTNYRKRLKRNIFKYWTIKKTFDFLNENNYKIRFCNQYYNKNKIYIIAELVTKRINQIAEYFDFQLLVDEINYEWIE